ncbi:peptidase [Ralstonia pseudosolanacearum]|uniref:peptidase n=1 Tax=Ralstonia pseudosolanacearum TaxID=1310165 RepID=UPI002675773E|nr:peptidase [Ralstonia pseudosolanacearum]MDO3522456.1 peptidase [Ralstonia pseudosolanacearum]MDO3546111.1 peptidase [Ralstonia pseudosolanacearum]MDO3553073.1 peptidase [Ralstonia pseudosolanacearum]MDO3582215.1 peptidase [Ralstonia pseudosolanacearum]MDO3600813.1 peptidase [Ralstonia pseudosolanacearum]
MTYCVAMRLDAGLVFLSDSRTNAGVDAISTFRKMTVFEREGDRVMVLLTAGNLAISQAVRQVLTEARDKARSLWTARDMFEATTIVGEAVREVYDRDAAALAKAKIDFNVSIIFGGQIGGERPRLFNVYAAGNFIEATPENCYFQIGEAKYGKPIIDRLIRASLPLDEAAKCALISMDSTLKSNISVGLPLDLLVYEADSLRVTRFVAIDEENPYFAMIRSTWGKRLRQVFAEIEDPDWQTGTHPAHPLRRAGHPTAEVEPVRIAPPAAPPAAEGAAVPQRAPGPAFGQGAAARRVTGGSHEPH